MKPDLSLIPEPDRSVEARDVSQKRKDACISRHGGICAYPQCNVSESLAVDHIIPLWMGGKNEDSNLEPLCGPHHAAKTKREAALRAKVKKLAGETGQNRVKKKIPGRGFQKPPGGYQWASRPFNKRKT